MTDDNATSVKFHIPELPLSLNKILRMHWPDRQLLQERFDLITYHQWHELRKPRFLYPVRIIYTLTFPEKRLRDFDNYIAGTKYLTDAIKKTFIKRDDYLWLKDIAVKFDLGRAGTTVFIEDYETYQAGEGGA